MEQEIGLIIENDEIVVNDGTNLDDLVRVLNDDYEQSLITTNKYIAHKKQKI